jgi:hypothetical protein
MASVLEGDGNEACVIFETIALRDNFSSGGLQIEQVGPSQVRLIWFVQKTTPGGEVQVPVVSIVIPSTSVMPTANRLAAAHTLACADLVGIPRGSG